MIKYNNSNLSPKAKRILQRAINFAFRFYAMNQSEQNNLTIELYTNIIKTGYAGYNNYD